ncbi:MAG: hypothetical protein Q4A02_00525 [Bacteroidales bacterium]|nr:hypothetical protein [Bacteroidales bacterium]
MNTIEVFETGKVVQVPGSWSEMTPKQVRGVFRIFERCLRRGESPLDFNVRVLWMLLGVRRTVKGWFTDIFNGSSSVRDENVYRMCETFLGFLFSEESAALTFDSVANPMPVVRSGLVRLYGPGELLQDLTFGEFRHASAAINRFFRSHEPEDLDECIAFLYRRRCRKANRAGRMVPDVDQRNARGHIHRASRLKGWRKNLVMMWFAACLKYLQSGVLEINGEEVDLSKLFAGDEKSSGISFGWNDLLVEVAKENTLGNIDRVDEEPLFSVLSIMWHNYKERKRNEQIIKASKAH